MQNKVQRNIQILIRKSAGKTATKFTDIILLVKIVLNFEIAPVYHSPHSENMPKNLMEFIKLPLF